MSIDCRELRIGNWVLMDGVYVEVNSISKEGINYDWERDGLIFDYHFTYHNDIMFSRYSKLEPIFLTQKIIENNCGFEYDNIIGYNFLLKSINKRINIPFCVNNEIRMVLKYFNGVMTIAENIIYLHQLQNIIFSLNSTDLVIKF